MLIFVSIYSGILGIISAILDGLFSSINSIEFICCAAIFLCIAVAVFMKINSAWGWMFIAVITMVVIEAAVPHRNFIQNLLALVIAGYGTYQIKKPMWKYLKKTASFKLPGWARTVLRFI